MGHPRTVIIGGGAAGFFLAINLKELCPQMEVTIVEAASSVLRKVAVSGGGRCNCTNSFEGVGTDLQEVYPRGHRLMRRLLRQFSQRDAYAWFEHRGVPLVTQPDHCVFPRSQDAHSIISLFLSEARRLGITIITGTRIDRLDAVDADFICVTTGGQPAVKGLQWLDHPFEQPVPSLFTFAIDDPQLTALMGTVAPRASALIPGTRLRSSGPLLITHWGMSGPCILRLSSYAARVLSEADYRLPLAVNWTGLHESDMQQLLATHAARHPQKLLTSLNPFDLPQRLWTCLAMKALADRAHAPWGSLNRKEQNRLVNTLACDAYHIASRAPFKDEFVTCGGIALTAVDPSTLESRLRPGLYFAGEVLDIDGVTGGFNFQAAWTTAYTVAKAISNKIV